jgi:cytoskeletal protein CcmA (bactofilin family)
MPIFRRDSPSNPPEQPAPQRSQAPAAHRTSAPRQEPATLIAAGTRVRGELSGRADITIEGQFEGKIVLDSDVTVRAGGQVQGTIEARSVRIGGKMVGDVQGVELVEITSSGTLEGNVSASRVVIAEGAFFKGEVEMTGERSKPKTGGTGGA